MSYPPQHMAGHGYGYPMMPPMGQPPMMPMMPGMPMQTPLMPTPLNGPEHNSSTNQFAPVHVPMSTSTMKVATTVFVGNISDKATDTLIRQMLLRCGSIVGWKRVQDASGKLQAFGFCEYAEPDSTLRALRLLHDRKLGDKPLVVKVDAKTRKDLLKYVTKKKRERDNETADEHTIDRLVAEMEGKSDSGVSSLTEVLDNEMKAEDDQVNETVSALLKQHLEVLTSNKSTEDIQREHDVKESILFMAKQCGTIDPESTLDDMEMEEGMKTLVSDEIKRFRQAYKPSESRIMERKKLDDKDKPTRDGGRERERNNERERGREKESPPRDKDRGRSSKSERSRSPRARSRSSPPQRSRTPPRSRSQERVEREKKRHHDREKEREDTARDEEDYEERMRQRKLRSRDKAYRECLSAWENRERRKQKDYDKELAVEESRRVDMQREKKHLADFLEEYDDSKDDQKYYRGSAFARRRREREVEMEEDERDRIREKKEIESLRLKAIERQARSVLKDSYRSESEEDSPSGRSDDDDDDMPKMDVSEDIPLTKTGFTNSSYPPIQVQPAPNVDAPPIKTLPKEPGIMISASFKEEAIKSEDSPAQQAGSPQVSKFSIGLKKATSYKSSPPSNPPQSQTTKLEAVFSAETDEVEEKPKKMLVPIDYSDDEENAPYAKDRRLSTEDKKKMVQNLVNSIPSSKEEVFKYTLRWEQMDSNLIEKRVKPWINKKITEYIGETEPILTEFICNKLSCHIPPADILSDIGMVLDDEAEMFVVKLWRLLIYETEAKHLGIAKSY